MGTVVDQTGAVIPNAKVVVTNQATHVVSDTVSGGGGDFRIPALPGGTYQVSVEASGFSTWTQADILLESNQVKTLYPVLALGAQKTTVQVKATVAAVQTAKSDTSREPRRQRSRLLDLGSPAAWDETPFPVPA